MERISADYSRIADSYDHVRQMLNANMAMWLCLVSGRVGKKADITLLDLGCGTGRFSIPFAEKLGYRVVGIDKSAGMIRKASEKVKTLRLADVTLSQANASELPFSDNRFDVIWMSHLLHHTDKPLQVIREAFRVLKPDGIIFNRYGAWDDIHDDLEHKFSLGCWKLIELELRRPNKLKIGLLRQVFFKLKRQKLIRVHTKLRGSGGKKQAENQLQY